MVESGGTKDKPFFYLYWQEAANALTHGTILAFLVSVPRNMFKLPTLYEIFDGIIVVLALYAF